MREYDRETAVVKRFRDDFYRITLFKKLPRAADDSGDDYYNSGDACAGGGSEGSSTLSPQLKVTGANEEKLYSSLARSRSMVYQLAVCNDWDYFCTMTIDGEKHNRSDLKAFRRKLSKWFNNYNSRRETAIKFLLVPELHRDKTNFHIHGLLYGLPDEHLTAFTLQDKLPRKMLKLIKAGRQLYNWQPYAASFGWVSVERIQKPEAIAKYISKYINKGIGKKIELNDHVYYCSQGLQRAEVVYKGKLTKDLNPDFINEHISIKTVGSMEEAMTYFFELPDPKIKTK